MIDWKFSEVGIVENQEDRQNFLWNWAPDLYENLSVIGTIEAEFHEKYQEIEKLKKELHEMSIRDNPKEYTEKNKELEMKKMNYQFGSRCNWKIGKIRKKKILKNLKK